MGIINRTVLFGEMPEPTDADFKEIDEAEAKAARLEAKRDALMAAANKKRGMAKEAALADLEADLSAEEVE